MVSLTGVSKWYHGRIRVLDHVNLNVKKGDFLYVLGGTGAGKSSLLRMLATEETPSSGSVVLFGYDLAAVSPATLRAIRQSIGHVPQDIKLIQDLSVHENVALSVSLAGRRALASNVKNKIDELLERLGLIGKRHRPVSSLSGGEAQRVAVARALARSPELLVADEPTGAQDKDSTWSIIDLFFRANAGGTTVVLATHDREIVRRVRRRCAILRGGRVTLEEPFACSY